MKKKTTKTVLMTIGALLAVTGCTSKVVRVPYCIDPVPLPDVSQLFLHNAERLAAMPDCETSSCKIYLKEMEALQRQSNQMIVDWINETNRRIYAANQNSKECTDLNAKAQRMVNEEIESPMRRVLRGMDFFTFTIGDEEEKQDADN